MDTVKGSCRPSSSSRSSVLNKWEEVNNNRKPKMSSNSRALGNAICEEEAESAMDERIKVLRIQNAKAKVLLENSKTCSLLLQTQQAIRAQQLNVLKKANILNSKFVKNMETILQLGHCSSKLQDRTDGLSRGLIKVHNTIHDWDDKLEDLILNSKKRESMLNSVLGLFSEKLRINLDDLSDQDIQKLYLEQMEFPELPEEIKLNEVFLETEMSDVRSDWNVFRKTAEAQIKLLTSGFDEICLEYGIREPNPGGLCPGESNFKGLVPYTLKLPERFNKP